MFIHAGVYAMHIQTGMQTHVPPAGDHFAIPRAKKLMSGCNKAKNASPGK